MVEVSVIVGLIGGIIFFGVWRVAGCFDVGCFVGVEHPYIYIPVGFCVATLVLVVFFIFFYFLVLVWLFLFFIFYFWVW